MNIPYPIEPYNPWSRGLRKKTLAEQIEEDEMFFRILHEQQRQAKIQESLTTQMTVNDSTATTAAGNPSANGGSGAAAGGAGGVPPYEFFHPPQTGDNNMTLYGHGSPVGVTTPQSISQLYIDQDGPNYWLSTGLTNNDWQGLGSQDMQVAWEPTTLKLGEMLGFSTYGDLPGITKIVFEGTTSIVGFDIESVSTLTELDFPNLVSIDPTNSQGGFFFCSGNTTINTISFPKLKTVAGQFAMTNLPSLTQLDVSSLSSVIGDCLFDKSGSLSIPSLASVGGNLEFDGNPILSISAPLLVTCGNLYGQSNAGLISVYFPSYVPTNGSNVRFDQCALNASSVEQILRRCVLAGVTTCTIDLSGGTNTGLAALSAQGQADAATLGGQLTINS